MKQELKFCAEVYHRLYPHLDQGRPIYFCLDGIAAQTGRREHLPILEETSGAVPDLVFYFPRGTRPFAMEAKVVTEVATRRYVEFCGDNQPRDWTRATRAGENPLLWPSLWIGIAEDQKHFYRWEHSGFETSLAQLAGRGRTSGGKERILRAQIPPETVAYHDIDSLVAAVLDFARENGFYPGVKTP